MNQITHNNHFVPQLYLKQWSDDGFHVWAYRILVPHKKVPEWSYRSIDRVAYLRDLYTTHEDGEDFDDFEKWLEAEFENPVTDSLRKVLKDNPLSPVDRERLAKFLGAQDVRTPLSYLESKERWEKTLPELIKAKLEETVRRLEKKEEIDSNCPTEVGHELFGDLLDIQTISDKELNSDQAYIRASVTVGRKLWLQSLKLLLTNTVEVLKSHKWSIVRPARGYQWITTDHPVVKLNCYRNGSYDLKGGWGRKGGYIFMPLSPRHLLFTEVGKDLPDRMSFSSDRTRQIQDYIAERALRWIFARDRLELVNKLRPRRIDSELFNREIDQWSKWHEQQIKAESSNKNPPNPASS